MRIAITADHNGVSLKKRLCDWLEAHGHEVEDRGAHVGSDVVDYPPLCEDACRRVLEGHADYAVIVGGSGSGEAIACNKLPGIRAGLGHDVFTTQIARGHNDANVLVLGAKVIDSELAEKILETWLATPFKGGRHEARLDQIAALERGESLI
jgi:ribose 5-phosphate isomerase B